MKNPDRELLVDLFSVASGNAETYVDGVQVRYNTGYLASTADDDDKPGKSGENLSSFRENKDLSAERRPLFASSDTIFLHITNTAVSNYRFKIQMINFSVTGLLARLEDHYLHTAKILDTYGGTNEVDFSVTNDPASADPFRFSIVFITARSLPVNFIAFTARQSSSGTANELEWKVSNQLNMASYMVERSANGLQFTGLATLAAVAANAGNAVYRYTDQQPLAGNAFYRIRSIGIAGEVKLSQVLMVKAGKAAPSFSVYPNPVINHTASLLFSNKAKGLYQLQLINTAGQTVYKTQVLHSGGNGSYLLLPDAGIAPGHYILQLTEPGNTRSSMGLVVGGR